MDSVVWSLWSGGPAVRRAAGPPVRRSAGPPSRRAGGRLLAVGVPHKRVAGGDAPLAQPPAAVGQQRAVACFERQVDLLARVGGAVEELLAVLAPLVDDVLVRRRHQAAGVRADCVADLVSPIGLDDHRRALEVAPFQYGAQRDAGEV